MKNLYLGGDNSAKLLWLEAGAIIVLLGAQFLLWPWVLGLSEATHEELFVEQQVNAVKSRNEESEMTLKKQAGYLEQLDVVVPADSTLPQQVEKLEQLAASQGVKLRLSAITDEETKRSTRKNTGIVPVKIGMQISGPLNNVLGYLERVEHQQEIVTVSRWWLKPALPQEYLQAVEDGLTGTENVYMVPFSLNVDAALFLKDQSLEAGLVDS